MCWRPTQAGIRMMVALAFVMVALTVGSLSAIATGHFALGLLGFCCVYAIHVWLEYGMK